MTMKQTKKTQEDFDMILHKTYDVDELSDYVARFSDEWLLDTSRQRTEKTHSDTQAYFIHRHPLAWVTGEEYRGRRVVQDEAVFSLVDPIVKDLESVHDGKVGQCLLIKLLPYKEIKPHRDAGDYLMTARRNHIAVITNPSVTFSVGEQTVHMARGECWQINNAHTHAVKNSSGLDRVHLLVDIIPNWALKN